jgi:hypothetical protein
VGVLTLQHATLISFIIFMDFAAGKTLRERIIGSVLVLGRLRGTGIHGSQQQTDGYSEKAGSDRCKHCGKLLSGKLFILALICISAISQSSPEKTVFHNEWPQRTLHVINTVLRALTSRHPQPATLPRC